MAGIADLAFGALKRFGGEAAGDYLSPIQQELLSFFLSPQGYLLSKGIGAIANATGFGNEYQDLQDSGKANSRHAGKVIRDSVGDILPDSVGNMIRATPKNVPEPSGSYFDPKTFEFVQSSEPADPFAIGRFNAVTDENSMYNSESPTFMGPKTFYDPYGLPRLPNFDDYTPDSFPTVAFDDGTDVFDFSKMDLGDIDFNDFSGIDLSGVNFDNYAPQNFSTDIFDYDFSRGGQIYRGRR